MSITPPIASGAGLPPGARDAYPGPMAGGVFAQKIPCDGCLALGVKAPAVRVYDGGETDHYECARGHSFGIHWRQLPTEPMWPEPTPEQIAVAAYFRWLHRGGGDGGAQADWLEAERALGA